MKYLVNQTIIAGELNKLPVFVTLRDWDARDMELIDFIIQQFEICNFPDAGPFIEYLFRVSCRDFRLKRDRAWDFGHPFYFDSQIAGTGYRLGYWVAT